VKTNSSDKSVQTNEKTLEQEITRIEQQIQQAESSSSSSTGQQAAVAGSSTDSGSALLDQLV
jgi:cell division septum initiation protein DivIVA